MGSFNPIQDLIDDFPACETIFKSIFKAPLASAEHVYVDEWAIMIEGDNGDMVPDYARVEMHFDGDIYCCICRGGGPEQEWGIGNVFALVDLIRSLGYSPEK